MLQGQGATISEAVRQIGVDMAAIVPKDMDIDVIQAAVAGETLEVRVKGFRAVNVPLPFAVDAGSAACALRPGGRGLDVTLPYRSLGSVVQEMREAAPHRFGTLDFTNQAFLELE